ncbi:MAG: LOG family protein [Candidatus Shapirobacteria bacterium]
MFNIFKKTTKTIKKVAFFGANDAKKTDQNFIDAYNTAKLLAESGYIIVNGGGPGVMLASTLGAKAGNGKVEIVVLDPKKVPDNYEGIYQKNYDLADQIIVTRDYPSRLNKLVASADAFVIFEGGTGTLSEVGLVWEMAKFEYGHHEPIVFFGKKWGEIVKTIIKDLNFESKEKRVVALANTAQEVLEIFN